MECECATVTKEPFADHGQLMQLLFPLSLPPLQNAMAQQGSAQSGDSRLALVRAALKEAGLQRSKVQKRTAESDSLQSALSHELWLQRRFALARPDLANTLMCMAGQPKHQDLLKPQPETVTWLLKPVHLNLALDHLVLAVDAMGTTKLNDPRLWLELLRDALETTWTLDNWTSPRGETYLILHTPIGTDWAPKSSTQAMGRSIDRYLPLGKDARAWRRFLNHTQMLLHEHPLNAQREKLGLATINGFWLEGETSMPAATLFRSSMGDLLGDLPGLFDPRCDSPDERVIVVDDWITPTHQGDIEAWSDVWKRFPAFAQTLQKSNPISWNFFGEAAQLSIDSRAQDRWRFWRLGALV
jgi:hypothetical protein